MLGCAWAEGSGWGIPVQYSQVIPEGEDVYDWCLTQAEIQGNINKVNGEQSWAFPLGVLQGLWWDHGSPVCGESHGHGRKKSAQTYWEEGQGVHFKGEIKIMSMQALAIAAFAPWSRGMIYLLTSGVNWPLVVRGALEEVDNALERQDVLVLHRALQDPALALRCLQRDNLELYLEQLSTDREEKALVGMAGACGAGCLCWRAAHGPQEEGGPMGWGVGSCKTSHPSLPVAGTGLPGAAGAGGGAGRDPHSKPEGQGAASQ